MDMYFYVDKNGKQAGPINAENLLSNGVNEETLVWKAGMEQWKKAKDVPELNKIFNAPPIPPQIPNRNVQSYTANTTSNIANVGQVSGNSSIPTKPDSYLVWAIFSTICCCVPIGGYAIYCAIQVDNAYKAGNYSEAKSFADKAKTWSIVGAICGLVFSILYGIIMVLAEM